MKFSRVGGLSPVKYKKGSVRKTFTNSEGEVETECWSVDGFHTPPCRNGIYAFIAGYEEPFLAAWKLKGKEKLKYRKFDYIGDIWCHFTNLVAGEMRGSWVKTHTSFLEKALQREINRLRAESYDGWVAEFVEGIKNPFKRGLGGMYCKDHLEVFIEGKNLNKIK